MIDSQHKEFIEALNSQSYTSLKIKRYNDDCYLIIDLGNSPHVFINKHGEQVKYRNVWQIKEFLENNFNINMTNIDVENIKN